MKTIASIGLLLVLLSSSLVANGVAVLDAHNAVYLRLDSTIVRVNVEGQISITTTTQYFTNKHLTAPVKYGFPLSEQASATQLRWRVGGEWFNASVAGTSQDTTLPGDGAPHPALKSYLGPTPLYFGIPQPVHAESTLVVELTYVELLPYAFGNVDYVYPGDYHLIQSGAIAFQELRFELVSPRTIDSIKVLSSHPVEQLVNTGGNASVLIRQYEAAAAQKHSIRYSLSSTELGLFAYTTALPDSLVPDSLGRGFMTFIAEPEPTSTEGTIAKVFTLIVDRSGSMLGTKIVQARDAASFIVRNLNPGDKFNIVDFSTAVSSFRPGHVENTQEARDSALAYIAKFVADGWTNISDAFGVAVPQFKATNDSTANIVIFLTDGQATTGITATPSLVSHIDGLITSTETNVFLFSFGIGGDANRQLLSLISSNHGGLAEFLGNDELYSRITDFYLTIRNPVLLNSSISFAPPIVTEVYPTSLPNLYKGKQMIVAGRYQEGAPVQITLSGTAFGKPVSYTYDVQPVDSAVSSYQFLPKIWAKRKIESLLVQYYTLSETSAQAVALKQQIIAISQAYGVITTFTSFSSGGGHVSGVGEEANGGNVLPVAFELLGNYPNPFNPSTTIRLRLNTDYDGAMEVRIYNTLGQLVRVLSIQVNGKGIYNVVWDGLGNDGRPLPSGVYLYGMELHNRVLVGKMNLLK
jgi:Ca-activated chloride channel family protein